MALSGHTAARTRSNTSSVGLDNANRVLDEAGSTAHRTTSSDRVKSATRRDLRQTLLQDQNQQHMTQYIHAQPAANTTRSGVRRCDEGIGAKIDVQQGSIGAYSRR